MLKLNFYSGHVSVSYWLLKMQVSYWLLCAVQVSYWLMCKFPIDYCARFLLATVHVSYWLSKFPFVLLCMCKFPIGYCASFLFNFFLCVLVRYRVQFTFLTDAKTKPEVTNLATQTY